MDMVTEAQIHSLDHEGSENDDDNDCGSINHTISDDVPRIDDDDVTSDDGSEGDVCLNDLAKAPPKLNYSGLLALQTELCRAVANDQEYLSSAYSTITMMIQRVRQKKTIDVTFDINPQDVLVEKEKENRNPLPAIARTLSGARRMRRKRSHVEILQNNASTGRRNPAPSKLYPTNEANILPPPKSRKRSCGFCHKGGHIQKTCPSLLCYAKPPLPQNDRTIREVLIQDMAHPDKYTTHIRLPNDTRNIVKSFPVGAEGVVVHRRYMATQNIVQRNSPENLCLECTVLKGGGENELFTRVLFKVPAVNAYINRSKTNIVICELESSSGLCIPTPVAVGTTGYPHPLYAQTLQMSQEMNMLDSGMIQFSQENGIDESMGYGGVAPHSQTTRNQHDLMGYGVGPWRTSGSF